MTGVLKLTDHLLIVNGRDFVGVWAKDYFTVNGPSGTVPITARFGVDGSAALPAVNPYQTSDLAGGFVNIAVCGPRCGTDNFDNSSYAPDFGGYYPCYSGPVSLMATYTWSGRSYLERRRTKAASTAPAASSERVPGSGTLLNPLSEVIE